jgi:hypothetical protein
MFIYADVAFFPALHRIYISEYHIGQDSDRQGKIILMSLGDDALSHRPATRQAYVELGERVE